MRIAYFTDTFYPQVNGVTNTFHYLSNYLHKNNIEHIFFAPDYQGQPCDETKYPVLRFKGISPRVYPECSLAFPAQHKIVKELAAFRPDVVHIATELGVGWSGLRAAQELGLPIVMSYHTNYNRYLNFYNLHSLNKAIWGYLKWFHGFAEMNLCTSEHTLYELAERGLSGLGGWSSGEDAECFHPGRRSEAVRTALGGAGKTIFLYVGRIAAEKGLDTLAESIRSLNAAHQNETLFVFTGEG
ncbi:MAG: glycosyltransferase, partial [Oscillospiraceae bacterium]